MRRDRCKHLLIQPQLFIRVGKDKYAMVDEIKPGEKLYIWDDEVKRIVPYYKEIAPQIF